jgi:hypothetical protein
MTNYEKANCIFKINGYYSAPVGNLTNEQSFEKAKAELIYHIKNELRNVESITSEQFFKSRKLI